MENSINQINETRRAEREELAAWTPYPGQLAQRRAIASTDGSSAAEPNTRH